MTRFTLFAAGAVALAASFTSVRAQEYNWDLANEYAPTSLPGQLDKMFIEIVGERTDGRIEITPHFGGAIGFGSEAHLEMVQSGAIELANTPIHFHGGTEPFLEIGALPFIATSPERAQLLYKMTKEKYEEVLGRHNQIPLAATPWPPSGFWAKKPITEAEDLQGWKARTFDRNGQITLQEAGASPIRMGWADVIPALSTNAIEGVLTSAEGGVNSEFWQYLNNFTEVNYATPLSMIHMNLDVWNSLSPEDQKILREAGEEVTDRAFAALTPRVQQNYETMREEGMTITTKVPPQFIDFLKRSAQPAINRWLERMGPEGENILKTFRDRVEEGDGT